MQCLFCCRERNLHASHIIAQKNAFLPNHPLLLQRAGISQIHAIENGLLLCSFCHPMFDNLLMYVDCEEDRMIIQFVNKTDNAQDALWNNRYQDLRDARRRWCTFFIQDGRVPEDDDGQMRLWFFQNSPKLLPSRVALDLHKRACLIWRLAGGADPDVDEECYIDEEPVPALVNKDFLDRIKRWNSNVTMTNDNV